MRIKAASLVVGLWCLMLGLAQAQDFPNFAGIVEADRAAVVNISTTSVVDQRFPSLGSGHSLNPFSHHGSAGSGSQSQPLVRKSLGSGFIISANGYILTCAHVVENAKQVIVKMANRRDYVAHIVGLDMKSDVALLKIHAHHLPTVTIGHPSRLQVGDWVVAIGAPFGFGNSVTAGIVSAKRRSLPDSDYVPFIQTDVPINPGNSGGPLFDLRGHVVGINSQIYSRTGGFMGLSFAIPINLAMHIGHELRVSGHVQWGWLGVTIQNVTRKLAESFHMSKPYGALVSEILPNSPAAHSPLHVGDVIVRFNRHPVMQSSALPPLVGLLPVGSHVPVEVLRDGHPIQMILAVGALPRRIPAALHHTQIHEQGHPATLGLYLQDLGKSQRKELGISTGVRVSGVTQGAGEAAGIEPGDIILSVDGRSVVNVAGFQRVIANLPKPGLVPILIRRGRGSLFLPLTLK